MAKADLNHSKDPSREKSRLGRLLVNRGYITDQQLEAALISQRATGQRLGEILVAEGLITERALARTLRQQKRYRYVAAFAAVVVAPLQPMLSFAATAPTVAGGAPVVAQQVRAGLEPLSELELRQVQGQGTDELFARIAQVTDAADGKGKGKADSLDALALMTRGLVPIINLLDADMSIRGVHYRPGEHAVRVLADGGIRMMLPQQIERISMENIRVQNSAGPSMGDIYISDVRFSPGSSITIRTH